MSPAIVNPSPYLRENGPILEIVIQPSSVSIDLKKIEKRDIPFIKVRALIDTGASTTAVSQKVIDKLRLVQTGTAKVYTSAKTAEIRNEYDACVEFDTDAYVDTLRVLGANLQDHSIDCLIGRDILSYCNFNYMGPAKKFVLSFGEDARRSERQVTRKLLREP